MAHPRTSQLRRFLAAAAAAAVAAPLLPSPRRPRPASP
ncbi:twin-arginine translocation signal domain-containing protein [Nocardiopsis composta]